MPEWRLTPRRLHANGVPWLDRLDVRAWVCRGCGATGAQPAFTDVSSFARWAGDLKRAHARCGPPIVLRIGEAGHPLNPDRVER